jgi:ABC-2 type transport system permease protein
MTAATTSLPPTSTAGPGAPGGSGPVTFRGVLTSEWIKFRSLRSTVLTVAAAVIGMIALGMIVAYFTNIDWDHLRPRERARFDPTTTSLQGYQFAQLAIGVLGVLMVTGEYSTGSIRSTFAAVPRRFPVFWAKLLLFTGLTFVLMTVSAYAAFFGSQALLGVHSTTISAPGVGRAVFGVGLYLTVAGLLGVAFGWITRNTAGGIAALLGLLLVVPAIGDALPQSWGQYVVPYLPSNAGQSLVAVTPDPTMLAPWPGFAVFCAYAVLAIAVAGVLLRRRDV